MVMINYVTISGRRGRKGRVYWKIIDVVQVEEVDVVFTKYLPF